MHEQSDEPEGTGSREDLPKAEKLKWREGQDADPRGTQAPVDRDKGGRGGGGKGMELWNHET